MNSISHKPSFAEQPPKPKYSPTQALLEDPKALALLSNYLDEAYKQKEQGRECTNAVRTARETCATGIGDDKLKINPKLFNMMLKLIQDNDHEDQLVFLQEQIKHANFLVLHLEN